MKEVPVEEYPMLPDGIKLPIIYYDRSKKGFIKALIQFLETNVAIFDSSCKSGSLRFGAQYKNIPNCTITHEKFDLPEDDELWEPEKECCIQFEVDEFGPTFSRN